MMPYVDQLLCLGVVGKDKYEWSETKFDRLASSLIGIFFARIIRNLGVWGCKAHQQCS